MKRFPVILLLLLLVSCTYAIRKDLMDEGTRNPDLAALVQNPDIYLNKLFIPGGVIARTTLTPQGSEIQALYVPVDSWGHTEKASESAVRYMEIYPYYGFPYNGYPYWGPDWWY